MFVMTRRLEWYTTLWLHLIVMVSTDFQCICNYSKYGVPVYQNTTRTSVFIGVLDINDCKQYLYPASEHSTAFYAIMYKHQIGFVMEIHTKEINCQGTPPAKDIVTVSSLPPTELTARLTYPSSTQATASSKAITKPLQTTSILISQRQNNTTLPTEKQLTSIITTKSPSTTRRGSTKKPSTALSSISTNMSTLSLTSLVTLPLNLRTTPTPSVLQGRIASHTCTCFVAKDLHRFQNCLPAPTSGHVEMCPNRIQNLAKLPGELIAQLGQSCYEVVQTNVSWSHAELNCKRNGGHLIHIANQQEQDFIYNFLVIHHSHAVWLGLHDRNQEEHFEWTSGTTITYTNWKPGRKDNSYHKFEDCVYMTPSTGQWDDIQCGGDSSVFEQFGVRHAYICQYATLHESDSDGNIIMCPYKLHQQAKRDRGVLGQYGHSCYEIVPNTKLAWQHAEDICHSRGGHLAYISNIHEQAFVRRFLNRHSPNHAVWIGLTDKTSEGRFHWTSGTPVQFTNWVPDHVSNFVSSSQEDCVAFIPYKSGQWDDIPCGNTNLSIFGGTYPSGEQHPPLCQYRISAGPSLIG